MLFNDDLTHRLSLPLDSPTYTTDSNNNSDSDKSSRGDKYSLRPRSSKRRNTISTNFDEDTLKSVQIVGKNNNVKVKQTKPKQKPAPLSKYRRKTANARERSRMREINQAFETLRRAVPHICSSQNGANEKLTKITTLRLAMKYISSLSAVLSGAETTQDLFSDCSELDCFLLESDGESLPLHSDFSDHSLTPADFSVDFPDDSLTTADFDPVSPDFGDHINFDPFLGDFS
ncbi:helix-loop-helix protein delilah-like [Onthophagus taurus]|uniref:helix-loop-helix protein delilah-like n=1 Tax=Onthophagus taurus TaxID=166361 RepID=UPI000C206860|nr:helix-loop-helix protein delilah-like [Onthophagus taurus]